MNRILMTAACALLSVAAAAQPQVTDDTPHWAYPVPAPGFEPSPDDGEPLRMQGSEASYTVTQLRDLFSAPEWRPDEHPAMPGIVREGRRPHVRACGVCHRESGTGGPENANIAGLPRAYIVRQMHDYREGRRSTAVPGRGPTWLMIAGAQAMTDAEIEAAATYFASLEPVARVRVVETSIAPRTFVTGYVLAAMPGDATEPLGRRILELPEDLAQFHARDPHARFVAYVPPGSVARGEALVRNGNGRTVPCAACHGPELEGTDEIPPITGRSPTYLVRQLFEFKTGSRQGLMADQMAPTVARLSIDDMIDLAAYLATLPP